MNLFGSRYGRSVSRDQEAQDKKVRSTQKEEIVWKQMDEFREKAGQLQKMIEVLDRQMEQLDVKAEHQMQLIGETSGQQAEELKIAVQELNEKLDGLKFEIGEKIHSEEVKCYRNIKSLFNELDEKMEDIELGQSSLEKIQKSFRAWKFFSFFALLDFVFCVLYILYTLGIFEHI